MSIDDMRAMRPEIDALKDEICDLLEDDIPTAGCLAAMAELIGAAIGLTNTDSAFEQNLAEIKRYIEDHARHVRKHVRMELN
jgi:hypothetical protein